MYGRAGTEKDSLLKWRAIIKSIRVNKYMSFCNLALQTKFITPIYHCNINEIGEICFDLLKSKWSPAQTASSLLISIISLLTDCNPQDPLDISIAKLYLEDRKEHDRQARMHTKKYAIHDTI